MVRIGTGPPPFWKINHANSAYFRLFLGYFRVISATRPPLLDLGLPFLHILNPPLRSSIDFLPTLSNPKCWGKRTNARCPLCKNNETLCHVLNNCSVSLNQGRYTWRHDSILRHIVQLLQAPSTKSDVKMYADIDGITSSGGTIPAYILPTSQRPDLFLYNEKAKKAIIAERTVPFEPNIPKAHEIKQSRYAGLLSDLNRAGVNTSLVCFEIGSRGLITQDNVARIRSILKFKGVSFKKQISRDISKLALLGSYAIWNSRKKSHLGQHKLP